MTHADRDRSEQAASRPERIIGGLLALDRSRADRIAAALKMLDAVEANPVGWGGDVAVSLARSIRGALTPASDATCPPDATETPADTRARVDTAEDRTEAQGGCTCMAGTPLVGPGVLDEIGCYAPSETDAGGMDNQGAEIERLRRWKAEATEVILGLQDVGKALGLGLGERITGASAAKAAAHLTERAEAAEARVAEERAKVARVERLIAHLTDFVYVDDLRAALDGA